ncbi:MAG: hypothetical protein ACRDH5_09715 [bacterium]
MKRLIVSAMAALVVALAAPASAEDTPRPSTSTDLNVDLKFDRDGFRLGGQLFGLDAVYGAWLNGQIRRDGLTLDGRVQDGGRAFNFKLNAEFTEWLLRALRRDVL